MARGAPVAAGSAPNAGDVGDALFLVDDQVLDDVEILGLRLPREVRGRVAVMAAVVHVHVQVGADPVAELRGQARCACSVDAHRRFAARRIACDASLPDRMVEAMLHGHLGRAGRNVQRAGRCAMEVVRFGATAARGRSRRRHASTPSRRMRAVVAAAHRHARRNALAAAIADVERQCARSAPGCGAAVRRPRGVAPPTTSMHHQCGVAVALACRCRRCAGHRATSAHCGVRRRRRSAATAPRPASSSATVGASGGRGSWRTACACRPGRVRGARSSWFPRARTLRRCAGSSTGTDQDSPVPQATSALPTKTMRLAIRRPRRIDRVVERRVVVAVDRALALAEQRPRVVQAVGVDVGDEQVEVAGALRSTPRRCACRRATAAARR